jgi:hypothetical protein
MQFGMRTEGELIVGHHIQQSGPATLAFDDGRQTQVDATISVRRSFFSVQGAGEFHTDRLTALSLCNCDSLLSLELRDGPKAHIIVHEIRTDAQGGRCRFLVHS